MRALPELTAGQGCWRLPLCEPTAARVARALLAETLDQRRAQLAAVLSDDAPLALWAICIAHAKAAEPVRTVAELANYLAHAALAELRWNDSASSPNVPSSQKPVAELAQMAGEAAAVAALAADLAAKANSPASDVAYLVGLLHAAPQWFALAAETPAKTAPADLFPAWLAEGLASCESPRPPKGSAPLFVRQACQLLQGTPQSGASVDLTIYQQRALAVAEQWTASADAISALLPQLVAKLSRLENLEQDFERTLEAEKLESLKELAYGAGHEINNPLANISARAQTLLKEESDPERRRKLAAINTQAFRAHEMIADMMLFARPPQLAAEQLDPAALVELVLKEVRTMAAEQGTELTYARPETPLSIRADKAQLAVAVRALCRNALEALGGGGRLEVALRASAGAAAPSGSDVRGVQIVVSDNGPGFGPEVRKHLFDPFYCGREAGRGLGFGLSKCWRIAFSHGGSIDVESSPGRGATFVLTLPVDRSESGPGLAAPALAAAD